MRDVFLLAIVASSALLSSGAVQGAVNDPIVPDSPVMRLDEIGIYEIGYALRGEEWRQFPTGWSGMFDDRIGIACEPHGEQGGKKAFLLHPPWRRGPGAVYQQFKFRLPKARRILLCGATAMRSDVTNKSDGVTFRVIVNGRKLLETHRKGSEWKPFAFDLTHLAGKTAIIRFETDSGPKDDPGWDFSLWSDRELRLEGYKPRLDRRLDPPPLTLARLCSQQNGSVAPLDGFGGSQTVFLERDTVVLQYSGRDGQLEYRWQRPKRGDDPILGRLELRARMTDDKEVAVPLAGNARVEWAGPAKFLNSRWEDTEDGYACVSRYRAAGRLLTVTVSARMTGKSLMMDVSCDKPVIRVLDAGSWGPVLRKQRVTAPYYSGQVSYLPKENLFVNAFLDWTSSSASDQHGTIARYHPLTDGSLNLLRERIVYAAAWHLAEVLPNIPNRPSPFIGDVGGRIVLDIWGGRFADIAENLKTLHSYGIRDCIALIHVWQRSGYDNALPMHIPAAAELGGDEGMKVLVETGKRLGYLVALHENYVDYYPNYDYFDENDIALDSSGNRINAWYNPGTKIQSFAVKPNAILRLAETQSPEIHRRYGTNSCYLDVHSAVPPAFHVDFRAGEPGAGMLGRVWDVHRELWDYERKVHEGPVFGEGNAHWYWSGCLDGVEAQFGTGWPHEQGETAPLAVDFDLLKIHPLQANHGMGYYERWSRKLGSGSLPPMIALDQYRMQEVAYGHAGFLGARNWSNLPQAWLEHHLLTPVTKRYAAARPVEISYRVGKKWKDGSAAARAGEWKQVRIKYHNGLTVTANGADADLRVGDHTLPKFGWLAEGAGVTACTAIRDGVVVDYAETADSVFANARDASVWNVGNIRRIRPRVAGFKQTGPREFQISYQWEVGEGLDKDYHCFVHFVAPVGGAGHNPIHFQNDHALPLPTSTWRAGETISDGPYTVRISDEIKDGDYTVAVGLYTPGGPRDSLLGVQDDECRIRAGVLRVREGGARITFEQEKSPGDDRLRLYSQHLNDAGKVIDFGPVRTNGSVFIRRENDDWVLRTLPRDKPFEIELSAKRFGSPTEVRCVGGASDTVQIKHAHGWWKLPMNGASEYRWPAG